MPSNPSLSPVLIRDEAKDTPLHSACSTGASPQRFGLLLVDSPATVFSANKEKKLPVQELLVWFFNERGLSKDDSDERNANRGNL